MIAVILTFHVLIVLGLIVVVLLQRSDGGALGIGGGGAGSFMSGRSAANALTRTTSYLAAIFFLTSLGLAIIAGRVENADTVIEELTGESAPDPNAGPGGLTTQDLLRSLGGGAETEGEDAAAPGAALDEGAAGEAAADEQETTEAPTDARQDAAEPDADANDSASGDEQPE